MKLWSTFDERFEETKGEDGLTQAQKDVLNDRRVEDDKALFNNYKSVERSVFEWISKAETSKQAWEIYELHIEEKIK